jgi:hypothetical protein
MELKNSIAFVGCPVPPPSALLTLRRCRLSEWLPLLSDMRRLYLGPDSRGAPGEKDRDWFFFW